MKMEVMPLKAPEVLCEVRLFTASLLLGPEIIQPTSHFGLPQLVPDLHPGW